MCQTVRKMLSFGLSHMWASASECLLGFHQIPGRCSKVMNYKGPHSKKLQSHSAPEKLTVSRLGLECA
jgi:hypothetical protein